MGKLSKNHKGKQQKFVLALMVPQTGLEPVKKL